MPPQLQAQRVAAASGGGRKKCRPGKSVREDYRQLVTHHEAEIYKDPFNWTVESVVVPPNMKDPEVTMKFLRRLEVIAAEARAARIPGTSTSDAPQRTDTSSSAQDGTRARRLVAL